MGDFNIYSQPWSNFDTTFGLDIPKFDQWPTSTSAWSSTIKPSDYYLNPTTGLPFSKNNQSIDFSKDYVDPLGISHPSTEGSTGGSSVDWGGAFQAVKQAGSSIPGKAGQIVAGVGGLASSIYTAAKTGKALKNGLGGIKNPKATKAGNTAAIIGAAADLLGTFLPEKSEYDGPKGDITQTMDTVYDGISDAAMAFGPVGALVGGIMKGGSFLGKGMNALGGGTDGMTSTDAILGSSFLSITPIGLINGFGGKKADTITKDEDALETIGSSYTGSNYAINDALQKSGKKYGAFSSSARNKANAQIAEAKRQQYIISDIADETKDRFNIRNSMASINGNRTAFNMQGGYNQQSIRIGKSGLKIDTINKAKSILNKYKEQQTNQLQQGGILDPFEYYLKSLPENQRDSTNFRVRDYWEFHDKPKDFKEALKKGMFTKDKKGIFHARSVSENPETGEIEYMKASSHPTRYMESDWYEKGLIYNEDQNGNTITIQLKPGVPGYEDWKKFTHDYELVKSEPYWKYVRRKQKEIPSHKEGGAFIELTSEETFIELIDPISEFKDGGSINVIPDGALHARKHNMDVEGITKKGIPVVSEKDGKIEQQAEVEKEEIIFRLEVTQKLEELEKKFYSEGSTQKEKDECALEAGKLLVSEILYNTQDNTGKLLK